jgi:hypothetical protein
MKPWLGLATAALAAAVLSGLCRAHDEREPKRRFKGVEL